MYVRSTEETIDQGSFAERLASALNYSVVAAEVLVDVQLPRLMKESNAWSKLASLDPAMHQISCSRMQPQPSMIYVYSAKGQSSSSLSYPELAFA